MKTKKILKIAGVIVAIIIIAWVIFTIALANKMTGNIKINGIDCSFKTYDETKLLLEKNINYNEISIVSEETELSKLEVNKYCKISYNIEEIKQINNSIPFLERMFFFLFKYSQELTTEVEIDSESLNNCLIESNGTKAAENAYIKYNKNTNLYEIIPEEKGDIIDTDAATKLISDAIANNEKSVDIKDAYISAGVTSTDTNLISKLEDLNKNFDFSITYTIGNIEEILDKKTYYDWFEVDENGIPYLNEDESYALNKEKIENYVEKFAKKYNTVNSSKKFKTNSGDIIDIEEGSYGWELDKEKEVLLLIENINKKESIKREPVWKNSAKGYGLSEVGNTYVEVSKEKQHLWFYKDGNIVLESDVVTGNVKTKHETHSGMWYIIYKDNDTYLTGPTWNVHVNYWMPFNSSGEGLHDASWRNKFGGSIYKTSGSHGCVNLPSDFAKQIYELVDANTPVIIY